MSKMHRKPRQNADQWQKLINQQITSGMSAPAFCTQNDIAYQSFMRWRKKLELEPITAHVPDNIADFVELTAAEDMLRANPQWCIELDLAPGIQLRIAR